ncbi:MAG: hypothetical protein LBK08_08355 [Treponema sp.]|jgi:hypothetical protein|nr:hypothetical protein [Treponema sp.]
MKKIPPAAAILCFLLAFAPDGFLHAAPPELVKISTDIPDFVTGLPSRADTIYGYGAAIAPDLDESLELAETHAKRDLSGRIVEGIPSVSAYITKISGGAWDPLFIQILLLADRHIMDALIYTGVTVVEKRVQTPDGAVWCLLSLKKKDALAIITNVDRLLR